MCKSSKIHSLFSDSQAQGTHFCFKKKGIVVAIICFLPLRFTVAAPNILNIGLCSKLWAAGSHIAQICFGVSLQNIVISKNRQGYFRNNSI